MENELKKPIGLQIRETAHSIHRFIDSNIDTYMGWEATGIEGVVLGHIFGFYKKHPNEILTAKHLMNFFNIKKAGTSKLVSNLESKGYIETKKSKSDSRIKEIVLTEKGLDMEKKFNSCWIEVNGTIEKDLTQEEKELLEKTLAKIRDNVTKGEKV